MSGYLHHEKLSRLSAHLEEICSNVKNCGGSVALPHELADEIAATAGEIMVELAGHRGDELVKHVIEDARRLREVVRTVYPEPARVAESGRAVISDLELVIRQDRRAA